VVDLVEMHLGRLAEAVDAHREDGQSQGHDDPDVELVEAAARLGVQGVCHFELRSSGGRPRHELARGQVGHAQPVAGQSYGEEQEVGRRAVDRDRAFGDQPESHEQQTCGRSQEHQEDPAVGDALVGPDGQLAGAAADLPPLQERGRNHDDGADRDDPAPSGQRCPTRLRGHCQRLTVRPPPDAQRKPSPCSGATRTVRTPVETVGGADFVGSAGEGESDGDGEGVRVMAGSGDGVTEDKWLPSGSR
jgi:hypothetical protein